MPISRMDWIMGVAIFIAISTARATGSIRAAPAATRGLSINACRQLSSPPLSPLKLSGLLFSTALARMSCLSAWLMEVNALMVSIQPATSLPSAARRGRSPWLESPHHSLQPGRPAGGFVPLVPESR